MFLDSQEVFSAAQGSITTAGDYPSTNYLDTLGLQDDGVGEPAYLVVRVDTAFTGGTSLAVVLQTDTATNFATAMAEIYNSGAILTANLGASVGGKSLLTIPIPVGLKRYIRVVYRTLGTYGAGAISSFLVKNPQVAPIQAGSGFVVG